MATTDTTNFNQHFTVGRLLRYTWPTVAMSVTTSIYSMVDGLFVSNYTGTTAFAAINLVWPYVAVVSAACSFLRSALEAAAVLLLPLVLLTDGIWLSSLTAEVLAASIGAALLVVYRMKLGYPNSNKTSKQTKL